MPTYDYICNECSHNFEAFQSMSAEPLKECPECGKESVKRLIGTGAGLMFKGTGFYETDYKKPSSGSSGDSKSTSSSSSDSSSTSSTKSESKPAAKSAD